MPSYKRSQVEQVFARFIWPSSQSGAAAVLKSNLKRLLDLDRSPRSRKLDWPEAQPYAFYDAASPGHGAEIAYSDYHAFALLIGVRLLEGGVPQSRAVWLLRCARPALETAFVTLKATFADALQTATADTAKEHLLRNGFFVDDPKKMMFLTEKAGDAASWGSLSRPGGEQGLNVCSFEVLEDRLRYFSHIGSAFICFEISNPLFQLLYWLPRTQARKRGRP